MIKLTDLWLLCYFFLVPILPFIFFFVMLGLGLCKLHFSLADQLPRSTYRGHQKARVGRKTCFLWLLCCPSNTSSPKHKGLIPEALVGYILQLFNIPRTGYDDFLNTSKQARQVLCPSFLRGVSLPVWTLETAAPQKQCHSSGFQLCSASPPTS